MARGIAKITDTGADILLSNRMRSLSDITDETKADGSILGAGVINYDSEKGIQCIGAAPLFANLIGNDSLEDQGHVVFKISVKALGLRDDIDGVCFGSAGLGGVTRTMLSSRNSAATTAGVQVYYIGSTGLVQSRVEGNTGQSFENAINTITHDPSEEGDVQVEFCLSWEGQSPRLTELFVGGILQSVSKVNDEPVIDTLSDWFFAMTTSASDFLDSGDDGIWARDLIICNQKVEQEIQPYDTVGIFGDDIAVRETRRFGYQYDGSVITSISRELVNRGFVPPEADQSEGSGGFSDYTICDSVGSSGNLLGQMTAIKARQDPLVIIFAGTSDIAYAVAESGDIITDPVTGVYTRTTEMLAEISLAEKIVWVLPASTANQFASNDPAFIRVRTLIMAEIQRACAEDSRVTIVETLNNLGDDATNPAFFGYWESLGNNGTGPTNRDTGGDFSAVATQDDFYPSSYGSSEMSRLIGLGLFPEAPRPNDIPIGTLTKNGEMNSFVHDDWDAKIYGPVIHQEDDGTYRMFYTGYEADGATFHPCVATSTDLITWVKPFLNAVQFDGNGNNNILLELPGNQINMTDVILAEGLYVLVAFDAADVGNSGTFLYTSPDGEDFSYNSNLFSPATHGLYLEPKGIYFDESASLYRAYYQQSPEWTPQDTRSLGYYEFYPLNKAVSERTNMGVMLDFQTAGIERQYYDFLTFDYAGSTWGVLAVYNGSTDILGPLELWRNYDNGAGTDVGSWIYQDVVVPLGEVGDWDQRMTTVGRPIQLSADTWYLAYSGSDGFHDNFPARNQDLGSTQGNLFPVGGAGIPKVVLAVERALEKSVSTPIERPISN